MGTFLWLTRYNLYCCPHVAIVFCSDFGGWGESTIKLLLKSTNISAILQHMSVWFVSLQNSRVRLQKNTFILRKVVEISVIWTIKNTANRRFERSLFTLRDPAPLMIHYDMKLKSRPRKGFLKLSIILLQSI